MAMFDRVSSSASSQLSSPSMSVREEGAAIAEDTMFVAVSRQVSDTESVLRWALENRGGSQICILHVHQPDKLIPTELGKFPVHRANKRHIEAHRVIERDALSKKLDKHLQFCRRHGVNAGKIYIEMDSIQDGIVKLISDNKIGKLVMGAASDRKYSKHMIEILSEKANYVHQHAPGYCHIWFVCNKLLIHTREATENFESLNPVNFEPTEQLRTAPSYEIGGLLDGQSRFFRDRISDEYETPMLNKSFSHSTYHSSLSGPSAPHLTFPQLVTEENGIREWILAQQRPQPYNSVPSSTITRGVESPFLEELENKKDQNYEISEELQSHISLLESRIEKSDLMVEQLEQSLESALEQVENYKKERDIAIKQAEELRHQLLEGSSSAEFPTFSSELPLQEIEKATNKFDPLLKIGEDAYGNIYKGTFNFEVAVKVPHPSSLSSSQLFQQEVEIMSKLRHPNIVNLISICPESKLLIYEYCANGNLEDQLSAEVEGPPLLWQIRIRIAIELCTALMFLHSHKPQPIIHGDIRAENIHLDSKYTCKLNDFRASSAIASGTFSSLEDTVKFYRNNTRAISYAYTDPEYFSTGELTTKSDVYSYGIILLRLLTGKPAQRLTRQVQSAVNTDQLGALLDLSAGWPLQQAQQLAALALRCCEMTDSKRPDFEPDIWMVLESMKVVCD